MRKVSKLEIAYDEIDNKYSNATPEQMQEAIKKLQEEIEKNKGILSRMENAPTDKKEPFEKNIKDLEHKITNMKGYSKSRVQIHKIKDYRAKLEKKLLKETEKKESCQKALEKAIPELEEVLNKLKDEKYTMELDQYQYNDLLQKKEDLTKKIRENKEGKALASKRIIELKSKIGKCDLAWKTLFVNKDWDEIQRRAMLDEKRFTRKVDEKHPPIKSGKEKKNDREVGDSEEVKEKNADNAEKIKDEEKEKNMPAPLSRWDKIKNFFKDISWDKIKNFFKGISSKIKLKSSPEEEKEEEKKEEKEEKGENTESYKNEKRDKFLEGLRQYVDDEYRKQVKQEREMEYIEAHKIKPRNERTTEDENWDKGVKPETIPVEDAYKHYMEECNKPEFEQKLFFEQLQRSGYTGKELEELKDRIEGKTADSTVENVLDSDEEVR